MLKRTLTGAAAGALALCGLTACSSSKTSAAGSGASVPTVSIMVGGIDKQIYLPYQLAQQLGFYKKYGVNVVLSTEQQGGVGAEDAMISGQVDLAGAWYVHTIDFQTKGKAVEDIVNLSGAPGEREMCGTNSGVHSAADFSGKTLGVTDLGSGTDTLTTFLAGENNIPANKYTKIGVGAGATAIAALQNGKAACVMTTQPTVTAIEQKGIGYSAVDLATASGATSAMGGTWPSAGVLARADWVAKNHDTAQKVVDALVATMHWIDTHSATDIANALPPSFVQNSTVSKADYITALTQDKAQFLPDGIMPAGGPKTVLATEKVIGVDTNKVNLGPTFTNDFAIAANKLEGFTIASTPAGSDG